MAPNLCLEVLPSSSRPRRPVACPDLHLRVLNTLFSPHQNFRSSLHQNLLVLAVAVRPSSCQNQTPTRHPPRLPLHAPQCGQSPSLVTFAVDGFLQSSLVTSSVPTPSGWLSSSALDVAGCSAGGTLRCRRPLRRGPFRPGARRRGPEAKGTQVKSEAFGDTSVKGPRRRVFSLRKHCQRGQNASG